MKIFLSFLQSEKRHAIPAYGFWEYYIKNGITETGHEWTECPGVDWALGLVPQSDEEHSKWKEITWSKTIDRLKKNPADLFLSYLYPKQVDVSAVNEIKKLGIPCVNFFCDHVREFRKLPAEFEVFDLNWVPEHKAISLYKKANRPYINLPMPMWVNPAKRVLKPEINQQLTFIGSKDIQRVLFLERVISLAPDLPLAIYGSGWQDDNLIAHGSSLEYTFAKKIKFNTDFIKNEGLEAFVRKIKHRKRAAHVSGALETITNRLLGDDEYNSLSAASMVTIGINRYPSFKFPLDKPDTYSRLRDIEAPMLGACYLTEWTEGIEDLYDTEKEILTYKDDVSFIEQCRRLMRDPMLRKQLKKNGQLRALSGHTVSRSIEAIRIKIFDAK